MSPAKSNKPLIPYLRQSRKKERKISTEDQLRDIERWATEYKVKLAAPVEERGVSGSKPWRERDLGRAIEQCEQGKASGIVVAYQSRLSRENGLATAEVWEALADAKARLVCVAERQDVTAGGTGDDEFFFQLNAAIARREWRRFKDHWERQQRRAVEQEGKHLGPSPTPYTKGEDGRLVPNEYAPAVKSACELRAGGASWSQVAKHLTDLGVPTSKGLTPWSLRAASALLHNPTLLGDVRHGDKHYAGAHPAIITRALWKRIRARDGKQPVAQNGREPQLLAGLLRCESCGGRLTHGIVHGSNGKRYHFYRCRNRGACEAPAGVSAPKIEAYIVAQAEPRIAKLKATLRPTADDVDEAALTTALEEAEAQLQAFVVSVPPDTPGFAEGVAKYRAAVDDLRHQLAAPSTPAKELAQVLTGETVIALPTGGEVTFSDDARLLFAGLIDHVTVTRGQSTSEPVADRAEIAWRSAS